MKEDREVTQGQRLSRGEFLGFVLTMLSVAVAVVIAATGAVTGPWFGLVLAGMFFAILAVRIVIP